MPRLSQQLPKYRKHRASGQAIVELNGQRYYLGPHGTKVSRNEYDRLIAEWLANGRQLAVEQAAITVAELMQRFWIEARTWYVKNGKPTGEQAALKAALKPLRELYGRHPAVEFGPIALEAVRARMIGIGWSRGNINRSIDRVRRVFRWGVRKQLIPAEVIQALETVPGLRRGKCEARESAPVMPVADTVVDATLEHLPAVVADMVRLQRATGMRPAELCMMRPCDVDRTGDVWLYRPESHKTEHHGRERVVCLGPKAQEILLRYLARDAEAYCFRPCDSEEKRLAERHANRKTPEGYGNRPGTNRIKKPKRKAGEKYTTDSYRRAIHRVCEKHEIEKWAPNRLRHTAATEIRKEFGLEAAQVILGHSQANVTQVYAERDLAKGIEVAKKIG